jgi:putative phosphoribosyl transferase
MFVQPLFEDREQAGRALAERLRELPLRDPLVLAIPRGGLEVGAPIARALGAELDVVLSRKLRAAEQPELALGAVSESGDVYLNHAAVAATGATAEYLDHERRRRLAEIEDVKRLFRAVRPQAPVAGRSVIITDDGIATGSTMIAAIHTVRAGGAAEIIVAVPVAPVDRLAQIRGLCDRVVCLHEPEVFWAIGQFYNVFDQVSDERAVELLRESARAGTRH